MYAIRSYYDSKKIYSITDKGKEYLMRKLQKNPAASKYKSEILFSLCFSDYLSEAHAEFLLELYLKEVKNRISFLEVEPGGTPMTAGRNFVRGLGIKMYSSAVRITSYNVCYTKLLRNQHRPMHY